MRTPCRLPPRSPKSDPEGPEGNLLDASAFKIPTLAGSCATIEADIRALAEPTRGLLAGNLPWGSLGTARDLIEKTRALLSQNDIDALPAVPAPE